MLLCKGVVVDVSSFDGVRMNVSTVYSSCSIFDSLSLVLLGFVCCVLLHIECFRVGVCETFERVLFDVAI